MQKWNGFEASHSLQVPFLFILSVVNISPLTPGVHTSLTKWLDCVLCVQERRRKEVLGWVNSNSTMTIYELRIDYIKGFPGWVNSNLFLIEI